MPRNIVEQGPRYEVPTTEQLLGWMKKTPTRELVGSVPDLSRWQEMSGEQKMGVLGELLETPLWAFLSRGDGRTMPQGDDPMFNKYQGLVMPWMGEVAGYVEPSRLEQAITTGKIDEVILELGDGGLFGNLPSNPNRYWIDWASSTGVTPQLGEYYQMLVARRDLVRTVEGAKGWDELRVGVEAKIGQGLARYRQDAYLPEGVAIVTSQSATEGELYLSGLLGIKHLMVTTEAGSASKQVLEGEHPDSHNFLGFSDLNGKVEGYEEVPPAFELNLRDERGELKGERECARETCDWLESLIAAKESGRVALRVTAISKSGAGWERGGLDVNAAFDLANEYNKRSVGIEVVVVVDAAQGRLTRSERARLLERGAIIHETDSKYRGAPMFNHRLLIPGKQVVVARERIMSNKLLKGMGMYITQSDLRDLFDEQEWEDVRRENLSQLPDIPNIWGWLKREAIKDEEMRYDVIESGLGSRVVLESMLVDMRNVIMRGMGASRSKMRFVDEQPRWSDSTGLLALEPFTMEVDGKFIDIRGVKELHRFLAKRGLHVGQAFAKGERAYLRIAPPMGEVLAMYNDRVYASQIALKFGERLAAALDEWINAQSAKN